MLIISMGNLVWWGVLAAAAGATFGLYALLKNRPEEEIRTWLFRFGILIFVLYGAQRYFMFHDPVFLETYGSSFGDMLVQLLPLQLCYAGLILGLVALKKNYKPILAFNFYCGSLGAILAMVSPDGYFMEKSLLFPPVGFFFLLHGMLVCMYFSIGLLGLFPWGKRAVLSSMGISMALSAVVHVINLVGMKAGLTDMNYFYTIHPSGSGILELLWSWIPCAYFYVTIPASLACGVWGTLLNAAHNLLAGKHKKTAKV